MVSRIFDPSIFDTHQSVWYFQAALKAIRLMDTEQTHLIRICNRKYCIVVAVHSCNKGIKNPVTPRYHNHHSRLHIVQEVEPHSTIVELRICLTKACLHMLMSCALLVTAPIQYSRTLTAKGPALLTQRSRLALLNLRQSRFLGSLQLQPPHMLAGFSYCILRPEQRGIGFALRCLGLA